jgi:hypothetical protein
MKLSLPESDKAALLDELGTANLAFQRIYPGDRPDRQPVHSTICSPTRPTSWSWPACSS